MKIFNNLLKDIEKTLTTEEMTAGGTGSAFSYGGTPADSGATGGHVGNVDSYASGDARPIVPADAVLGSRRYKNRKRGQRFHKLLNYKKPVSMPMSKRPSIERLVLNSLQYESINEDTILDCSIIIKNPQFNSLIEQILIKDGQTYDITTENNQYIVTFKNKQAIIDTVLKDITQFIGEDNMDKGQVSALIYEIDSSSIEKKFPKEMKKGQKVEHEHTTSDNKARKIATDHLKEFPNIPDGQSYYHELDKMEGILKKREKKHKKVVKEEIESAVGITRVKPITSIYTEKGRVLVPKQVRNDKGEMIDVTGIVIKEYPEANLSRVEFNINGHKLVTNVETDLLAELE